MNIEDVDFTKPEQRDAYIAYTNQQASDVAVTGAVDGLKTKNAELLDKLSKQTKGSADMSALIESLGGEEGAAALVKVQKQLSTDERLQKLTSGDQKQIQEVLDSETSVLRASLQQQIDAAGEAVVEANQKADAATKQLQLNNLQAVVTEAARGLECRPGQEMEIFRDAANVFSFDENNMPVIMDNDVIKRGADGTSPFSTSEWLEGTRETNSYRWPDSVTGGALGAGPGGDGSRMPSSFKNQAEYLAWRAKNTNL